MFYGWGSIMRVLHVYAGNLYGGVETLLGTLARYQGLCPNMEPEFALCFTGRLAGELADAGVAVYPLGGVRISRPWTVWQARRRLARLLARQRFDAVICHSCWPHVVFGPVVRRRCLPLVLWAHDAYAGKHWLERRARRIRPDLVLANSRFTQAALPNLFADVRSEVLYLPVEAPDGGDRELHRRRLREELQTPADATVIIQVSRLERWKGHSLLLEALAQLRELPGWVCWVAGGAQRPQEAAYLAELRDLAARFGLTDRVRFLGQRNDVPQLLAGADIHCQPNTGPEPFGIAFVEALYAGLPVVTTALGGALEIVDPTCGMLVPPGPVGPLADALDRLIQDADFRRALGREGPARARTLCEPRAQLGKLRALVTSLVKEGVAA
jgi:glycosyltransferase involved in cell wall biosynthesis